MHIVILNGPKFSGKDTLAKLLLKLFPTAIHARMKDVLYTSSYENWRIERRDISFSEWVALCNDPILKDLPVTWLGNSTAPQRSPREALIYMSEEIIKKNDGPNGVALRTVRKLKQQYPDYKDRMFIFSDGGFNNEVQCLLDTFEITRKHMTVVRIDRQGCSFAGDSREYIKNPNLMYTNNQHPSIFLGKAKTDFCFLALENNTVPIEPDRTVKIADICSEIKPFKIGR